MISLALLCRWFSCFETASISPSILLLEGLLAVPNRRCQGCWSSCRQLAHKDFRLYQAEARPTAGELGSARKLVARGKKSILWLWRRWWHAFCRLWLTRSSNSLAQYAPVQTCATPFHSAMLYSVYHGYNRPTKPSWILSLHRRQRLTVHAPCGW